MELSDKDKVDSEKRKGEGLNFQPTNLPADWRFGINIQTPFLTDNSVTVPSSCATASMPDSFPPNMWDHSRNQNLACGESNLQSSSNLSHLLPGRMLGLPSSSRSGMERPLDYGWNSPNSQSKGAVFLQTGAGILHQNLSQFPADSGFIERAARFSCFSGGNYGDIMNPLQNLEPLNPFSTSGCIQATQVLSPNNVKGATEAQNKEMELQGNGIPLNVSWQMDSTAAGTSLEKDDRDDTQTLVKPSNRENIIIETKLSEVGEAKFDGQADPSYLENSGEEPYNMELGAKKRKRSSQEAEHNLVSGDQHLSGEAAKENLESKQSGEQNPSSSTPKLHGKSVKDGSKNLNAPKDDYIHVRARRGQATNSHSLAERVRREKISERMKFLQDLVPGCSKVTGKAVMLDEIINYVQSLQRQVEFLSMKLATVNPCLDFNIDGFLSKDILQTRGASSSVIGFSPDMAMVHPQLHLSQQGLMHSVIPGIRNPPSSLRRVTSSPIAAVNEFHTAPSQMLNVWDEEFHNVAQMNFDNNTPFTKEPSGSLPMGNMKVEL